MRTGTLAFFASIIVFCVILSRIPHPIFILGFIPITIICYKFLPVKYFIILLAFLLGLSWVWMLAYWQLANMLPHSLEKKTLSISGEIISLPAINNHRAQFEFFISSSSKIIRLSWYAREKMPTLKVGDRWQLQVRLKRPHGTLNPGGFDYERWLFYKKIQATGYVVASNQNHLINSLWYHQPINRLRQILRQHLRIVLQQYSLGGVIIAMIIGDRSGISNNQWQVFRHVGLSHLIAISGLHIGLIAGFSFMLINILWCCLPRLCLLFPATQAAAIAAMLTAVFYSALAGFSLPTQRALIMITMAMLSILWRRSLSWDRVLLITLLIILILDPFAVLTVSFWLSFTAVIIILYGMNGRLKPTGWWWRWGRVQWVVSVGLLPLTLLFFQQYALVSFCANMLAIPWIGFVVLPLCLLATITVLIAPTIGAMLLTWGHALFNLLWPLLVWLSQQRLAYWQHTSAHVWFIIPAIVGVILLLVPRGFPGRWLGGLWLSPMLLLSAASPAYGEMWLSLLDVGQGLATVVRTAHHTLVFDTGTRYNANFDLGKAVVVPFLRQQNVNHINRLVISHGDLDHIGGMHSILQLLTVDSIDTSVVAKVKRLAPVFYAKKTIKLCQKGEHWSWDGVSFTYLYPPPTRLHLANNSSCVLRISNGAATVLLTGDIEAQAERYLVREQASVLPATVLVVPHHGSATSSTLVFVHAVHPQYALVATGYLNRYRLPKRKVIERYRRVNAMILNTVTSGAISLHFDKHGKLILLQRYRQQHQHFWHVYSVIASGAKQSRSSTGSHAQAVG